jgi:hypothetical protein
MQAIDFRLLRSGETTQTPSGSNAESMTMRRLFANVDLIPKSDRNGIRGQHGQDSQGTMIGGGCKQIGHGRADHLEHMLSVEWYGGMQPCRIRMDQLLRLVIHYTCTPYEQSRRIPQSLRWTEELEWFQASIPCCQSWHCAAHGPNRMVWIIQSMQICSMTCLA